MIGKQKEIICACGCGRKKMVRVVDIKRGWGRFYSKSCKAKYQERRTGQYSTYLSKQNNMYTWDIDCDYELGWDEHKCT